MEGRDQRRAVATGRDIAAAKIGDYGDSGVFGNARGVVQLQGPAFVGPMPHRLAMHARSDKVTWHHAGVNAGRRDGFRVEIRQLIGRAGRAPQLIAPGLLQGVQLVMQRGWKVEVGRTERCAHSPVGRREVGDDGIDAVEAGAGHHAGIALWKSHCANGANARRARTDARWARIRASWIMGGGCTPRSA